MTQPAKPKIYHIVHLDRLKSITNDGELLCDAVIVGRQNDAGTTIGMSEIKARRLTLSVSCHDDLKVGECVPFYFCQRSIMLYLIHCANHPELSYRGGQNPIVHLEADLGRVIKWAQANGRKWAFSLSNAGAYYFESRCDIQQLGEINWDAVQTNKWSGAGISPSVKEGKQAEFLIQQSFPWMLVDRIGVISQAIAQKVSNELLKASHRPPVEVQRNWYY